MQLCHCPAPVRDLAQPDRLRCSGCAGWTPHGRPHSADKARHAAAQAASFAERLGSDLAWLASLVHAPTRRTQPGRTPGPADPVAAAVLAPHHDQTVAYATVAARALERALAWLQVADTAAGDALLTAEPNRTPDHTKAPFHDSIPEGRPDLQEAHDARSRRRGRGEGWGAG